MLNFINFLDNVLQQNQEYLELENLTKEKVKQVFFDGNILKDGKDASTIRPNIFLAYYLYPDLLSNEDWEKVFDNSFPKLWLDWGGITTIQKDSPLFCREYTGEDNKSYHRGDSWFYINNITAMCLYKLNKEKYKEYIHEIINASTQDILYNGIIGRPSELSSASSLKAEASLFQLWSAATYAELMDLLFI
jgi:glycogen debranching enzyme